MQSGLVLVNGASGFLGRHVTETLAESGYDLRLTDLPGADLSWADDTGECVHADLRRFSACREILEGVDGVINVAGVFDFSKSYQALHEGNVRVSENMGRAAIEAGVRKFVHISTIGVYGLPRYSPMDEAGPKHPKNAYERTKKLGEDAIVHLQRHHGLPAAILRPGPIYGPRSTYTHSLAMALQSMVALSGKGAFSFAETTPYCHHIHVEDVARAARLLLVLPCTIGHRYNACDRTPIRWSRLFEILRDLCEAPDGPRIPWFPRVMSGAIRGADALVPDALLGRANRSLERAWEQIRAEHDLGSALRPRIERDAFGYLMGDHVYDVSALADLGFEWRFPETAEGLAVTHQWLVENRWIPAPPSARA